MAIVIKKYKARSTLLGVLSLTVFCWTLFRYPPWPPSMAVTPELYATLIFFYFVWFVLLFLFYSSNAFLTHISLIEEEKKPYIKYSNGWFERKKFSVQSIRKT